MGMWLYQLSAEKELDEYGNKYAPKEYRKEVSEGYFYIWSTRQIRSLSRKRPEQGDTVLYWYTKTSTSEPGLYGWGIIFQYNEAKGKICHVPVFPSDCLKREPIYDKGMEKIIKIVQNRMPQATLFEIKHQEKKALWKRLSKSIRLN